MTDRRIIQNYKAAIDLLEDIGQPNWDEQCADVLEFHYRFQVEKERTRLAGVLIKLEAAGNTENIESVLVALRDMLDETIDVRVRAMGCGKVLPRA